jgi:protein O-GlcNAc transferase
LTSSPAHNVTFEHALAAFETGSLARAELLFKDVLRVQPRHIGALNLLGIVLTRLGQFAEAESYLRRALQEQPTSNATLCNYGIVLKALNRPTEALDHLTAALTNDPTSVQAWKSRGIVFNDLHRFNEAVGDFSQAIRLNPRDAHAYLNKGKSLVSLQRLSAAVSEFERAAAIKPDLIEAWLACGDAYRELKSYESAVNAYNKAIALAPDWAIAHNNRAAALLHLRRFAEALVSCDRTISLAPNLALPHGNRATALLYLNRLEEALASCHRAISLDDHYADGWVVRGDVLLELGRYDDALAAYEKAGRLRPDLARAWLGRGNVFARLNQHELSLQAYDRAIRLMPDLAEAWHGRGVLLVETKRYQEAFSAYERALELKPNLAEAWLGLGNILTKHRRQSDAFSAYDNAFALRPDLKYAAGLHLHAKLTLCDWRNLEAEVEHLLNGIKEQRPLSTPFPLLAVASSAADQLECARQFVRDRPAFPPMWSGEVYCHDRIRVAYFSPDFHEHPVADLTVGLFERHERSCFEVIGLSLGPDQDSPMRQRLKAAFERFVDVRERTDDEIADLVRQLEIDILVDLAGHTEGARLNVLARRPAPIQVNYLGYIGTMGADFIDYVIADEIALPFNQQPFFAEKIVHLPGCFLATDDRKEIAEHTPSRQEAGLPPDGFVFCSFNNSYKLTKPVFEVWMRLLAAVPRSVLWLVETNTNMVANLRRDSRRCGIAPERLVFAQRRPMPQHLARQRLAGLFLDTAPYNTGATGAVALWAGVPLLTVMGQTFVGRMAASMLHAVGLPELVTHDLEDYEALALKLAREPDLLSSIRQKLQNNLRLTPLFDADRFRRSLEEAYTTMVDIHRRGDSPYAFNVEPG